MYGYAKLRHDSDLKNNVWLYNSSYSNPSFSLSQTAYVVVVKMGSDMTLGWTEGKKRSPIDSGILWANIDIY